MLEITGDLSQMKYFSLYPFLSCRLSVISFLCHPLSSEEGGLLYLVVQWNGRGGRITEDDRKAKRSGQLNSENEKTGVPVIRYLHRMDIWPSKEVVGTFSVSWGQELSAQERSCIFYINSVLLRRQKNKQDTIPHFDKVPFALTSHLSSLLFKSLLHDQQLITIILQQGCETAKFTLIPA